MDIKKIGLGVLVLLVLCNTVRVHNLTKRGHRMGMGVRGANPAMIEKSHTRQRPQRGSRSSEGRGAWVKEKKEGPKKKENK